jgi:hypothetical protein
MHGSPGEVFSIDAEYFFLNTVHGILIYTDHILYREHILSIHNTFYVVNTFGGQGSCEVEDEEEEEVVVVVELERVTHTKNIYTQIYIHIYTRVTHTQIHIHTQ